MRLQARETGDEALRAARALATSLKRYPVVVSDTPGFVVNRMSTRMFDVVLRAIGEGEDPDEVDRALDALGLPMRPLTLLDYVGTAVQLRVCETMHAAWPERFAVPTWLTRVVDAGLRGVRAGDGTLMAEAAALLPTTSSETVTGLADRVLQAMAEEAHLMLRDGVVASARDLDACMILGANFPFHLGGLTPALDRLGSSGRVTGQTFHPPGIASGPPITPRPHRGWPRRRGTDHLMASPSALNADVAARASAPVPNDFPAGTIAPDYEVSAALDHDYGGVFTDIGEADRTYWMRARRFVEEEALPVIAGYWDRAEYPLHLATRLGGLALRSVAMLGSAEQKEPWLGNGSVGHVAVVWARGGGGQVHGHLVPQDAPGYSATTIEGKASLRAIWQAHIRLEDVVVPSEALLPGSRSFKDTARVLTATRLGAGWACVGHPVGASGARLALHVALELARRGGGLGVAFLCGGGGQGDALLLRRP